MCGPQTPDRRRRPVRRVRLAPPPALIVELSDLLDRGVRVSSAATVERDPPTDPGDVRLARSAAGLLAGSTRPACWTAADVHVAIRLGALAGERTEPALLALALAVRGLRHGSVCIDLSAVSHTVLGEADELLDVSALPWPDPAGWLAALPGRAAGQRRRRRARGRPLRLVDGLLYLDRYWREEELVRRSLAAADGRRSAGRRPAPAGGRAGPAVRRRRRRSGSGWPPRSARCAGSACWPAGRAPARRPRWPRLLALLFDQPGPAAAGRAGRADRQGRGPAAGGGAPRRCPSGRATGTCRRPRTLHRLLGRRPGGTGSGTTRAGCPSTSWWSTRRRWCR